MKKDSIYVAFSPCLSFLGFLKMGRKSTHSSRFSDRLFDLNQSITTGEQASYRPRKKVGNTAMSSKRKTFSGAENILSISPTHSPKNAEDTTEKRRTRSSGRVPELDVNSSIDDLVKARKSGDVGRESQKMSRLAKVEIDEQEYSPIKTRGFIKNKARVKDRCRICKLDSQPLISCIECQSEFHLTCLGYPDESAAMVLDKRVDDWQCPMCVLCAACATYIYDPENVQCFACDRSYHGHCKSESNSSEAPGYGQPWYCPECKIEPSTSEEVTNESKTRGTPGRRKGSFRKSRMYYGTDGKEGNEIQRLRDELNDSLKDECKSRLLKEQRRSLDSKRRKSEQENRSPKKTPVKHRKHGSESSLSYVEISDFPREVKVVDGVKVECFSDEEKEAAEIADREAAEAKMMRISIPYDYELYQTAKTEAEQSLSNEDRLNRGATAAQIVHYGLDLEFEAPHKSPYPKFLSESPHLYVCRFCLTAMEDDVKYENHLACCQWQYPPGNEIYRDDSLSFWEIDGELEKSYCQRLCLFAKLFLSSKTLHREVEMFLFYLLTKYTQDGCVIVGYFSKEKSPNKNNNLSCLLTLPSSLRCGYGRFLIDLSYKLSLRERKVGGPEHPLSDLGLVTYRGYWKAVLFSYLRKRRPLTAFSLKEMTYETGVHPQDIVSTLRHCKMLTYRDGSYYLDTKKAYMASLQSLRRRVVNAEQLIWEPEFEVDKEKMGNYASNKPLF